MRKSWLARFLSVLLVVALVVGQMAGAAAMGVDDQATTSKGVMAGQNSEGCCPDCAKDSAPMKSAMCFMVCLAAAQATLPSKILPGMAFYAASLFYERSDRGAVSLTPPPESPPPKA